ncbi:hypothetical protein MASR1M74_31980 [Lentimicrobium sp.]
MKTCRKPIYPILPSVINVKNEIEYFLSLGRINFPDEVVFGEALAKVYHTPAPAATAELPELNHRVIRQVIDDCESGYLMPQMVQALLDAAGIPRAGEAVANTIEQAKASVAKMGFPVVMKVVGPVHKSDVGGVVLNVKDEQTVVAEFERMMKIPETTSILIQPMLSGTQIFAGAKHEPKFGHMVLCGLGGIFIEVLKDVQSALAPVNMSEAREMIRKLKSYKIIEGVRGQEGVNQAAFADVIVRLSALCIAAPEIAEMDINPLLGKEDGVVAVDARIRIEK